MFLIFCAIFAPVGLIIALTAGPGGAPPAPVPRNATLACQITNPTCNEPVEAQSLVSSLDFTPGADAAMTAIGLTLQIDPNNGRDDGTQDFTADLADIVPVSGPGSFGFTAYDDFHYHGSPVFFERWTPGGFDLNLCLQATNSLTHAVVLRPCDGGTDQAWIATRHPVGVNPVLAPAYTFALSAVQKVNLAHHWCLTGTNGGFPGIVSGQTCKSHSPGVATDQEWSALP
jgi:hypothetical protein